MDRDSQYSSSQKTKRMRTSFKHHQLRTMKSYFAINHNPDAKDLKQLAQKTGLTKRVLQVTTITAFLYFTRERKTHANRGEGISLVSNANQLASKCRIYEVSFSWKKPNQLLYFKIVLFFIPGKFLEDFQETSSEMDFLALFSFLFKYNQINFKRCIKKKQSFKFSQENKQLKINVCSVVLPLSLQWLQSFLFPHHNII